MGGAQRLKAASDILRVMAIHPLIRATRPVAAVLSAWLAFPCSPVLAGGKDICVRISDMYRGRNCGTSDSVQVDVRSSCGVKVKGVVIFNQVSGDPIRFPVILDSGDRQVVFACHGNGKVDKDFDIDRQ